LHASKATLDALRLVQNWLLGASDRCANVSVPSL